MSNKIHKSTKALNKSKAVKSDLAINICVCAYAYYIQKHNIVKAIATSQKQYQKLSAVKSNSYIKSKSKKKKRKVPKEKNKTRPRKMLKHTHKRAKYI